MVGALEASGVLVRVQPCDDREAADDALASVARELVGVRGAQVRVGRRCPRCAGADHGRPVVAVDGRRLHGSISRTAGRTMAAASAHGPIGVDIERVDAQRLTGVAAVALHTGEQEPMTDVELATRWVRKEAVLKATGWGLPWGPERVDTGWTGASPFPVSVGRGHDCVRLWVTDLDVGCGYAAAVAVVSAAPLEVRLLR